MLKRVGKAIGEFLAFVLCFVAIAIAAVGLTMLVFGSESEAAWVVAMVSGALLLPHLAVALLFAVLRLAGLSIDRPKSRRRNRPPVSVG